jgi:hypothetical protein
MFHQEQYENKNKKGQKECTLKEQNYVWLQYTLPNDRAKREFVYSRHAYTHLSHLFEDGKRKYACTFFHSDNVQCIDTFHEGILKMWSDYSMTHWGLLCDHIPSGVTSGGDLQRRQFGEHNCSNIQPHSTLTH